MPIDEEYAQDAAKYSTWDDPADYPGRPKVGINTPPLPRGTAKWSYLTDGSWHTLSYENRDSARRERAALCAWARYNGYHPTTRIAGGTLFVRLQKDDARTWLSSLPLSQDTKEAP